VTHIIRLSNYNKEILTELTTLIAKARDGEPGAEPLLFERIYPELHAIARQRMAGEMYAAESTESLVHECYLRLKKGGLPEVADRGHFFAVVSRIMRQILVDFARMRMAQRRDKRLESPIDAADELRDGQAEKLPELLAIDQQLNLLEQVAPEAAQMVELRFFGGLTAEEIAEHLKLDVGHVRRRLRYGQGWLRRAIAQK